MTWEAYQRLDATLAAHGFHATSQWWRAQVERFYCHPTARTLVGRVGRGGAKSTVAVKVSLTEVLFGDFVVPPGERHYWSFVSENKDEAANRLRLIESMLGALGLAYSRVGDTIDLADMPRGWKVSACRVGALSGPRSIGGAHDEAAKWKSDDGAANPAREVIASYDAMTITHPGARTLVISSPVGSVDYHAELFDKGDTEHQITCHAASWVANPDGITEAECWRKSRGDERTMDREYRANPGATLSSEFDGPMLDLVKRIVPEIEPPLRLVRYFAAIDPASKRNAFTMAMARKSTEQRLRHGVIVNVPSVVVVGVWEWVPAGKALDPEAVIADIRGICEPYDVRTLTTDQHASVELATLARQQDLVFAESTQSRESKLAMFDTLRMLVLTGLIELPPDQQAREDLLGVRRRITPNGPTIQYAKVGERHCDYAPAIATVVKMAHDAPQGRPRRGPSERERERLARSRWSTYQRRGYG